MAGGLVPELPKAGVSGLGARALLGFMDRDEATRFLLEDCIFQSPLGTGGAEEIWQAHQAAVQSLPPDESSRLQKNSLSAADLKAARKFRSRYPQANSIIDFVSLPPMDLIVHQLWISTEIAERYSGRVEPQKWLHTALLDSPPDSGLSWRREGEAIIFDLPRYEYVLSGPSAPDGIMRPSSALDFVSVALHADRALLVNGYHRTFAAAQYARQVTNAPHGLLFGVSNFLQQMGDDAEELLRMMDSPRPPRLADFFDDRLAVPVMLRRRRYQMRIYCEVTAIDEEQAESAADGSSVGTAASAQSGVNPGIERPIRDVHAILNDALQHYSAGRLDAAAEQYRQILFLKPDHAEANMNLGAVLAKQDRWEEAVNRFQRALTLNPDYLDAHYNLGYILALQGAFDDAIVHQKRVIALDPRHARAHQQLGHIFKCQGRFDEAIACFDRAIALDPEYPEAHFSRAEIRKFHRGDPDLAAIERLSVVRQPSVEKAMFSHFALAKALEDVGDYARAFEHLGKGNALKRARITYDEPAVLKRFEQTAGVFDRGLLERLAGMGEASSAPVFVLGMPRSGSTLIEQILASHPLVRAGGELNYIPAAVGGILSAAGPQSSWPVCVREMDRAALQQAGKSYLDRLGVLADGKSRVVDKMPGNFLHIGLIRLILPNARIIHTVRDPMDTCVSCYSKLFESGHHYSYDLAELGRFYRRYAELMQHWRSVLPADSMLEVVYEDVVDDIEGQARRLIDYCGLPWDDRCIDFHKTNRAINTLSAFQVRQPLFRSSLQRWRRYETELGPLLSELGNSIQTYLPARLRGASAVNDEL
ncbi:MAG TPA: sulfotransferase [Bryobacteraceae bacterium]